PLSPPKLHTGGANGKGDIEPTIIISKSERPLTTSSLSAALVTNNGCNISFSHDILPSGTDGFPPEPKTGNSLLQEAACLGGACIPDHPRLARQHHRQSRNSA
ncbi:hypothetical protein RB213_007119, partial [Colletotrichum asianum]